MQPKLSRIISIWENKTHQKKPYNNFQLWIKPFLYIFFGFLLILFSSLISGFFIKDAQAILKSLTYLKLNFINTLPLWNWEYLIISILILWSSVSLYFLSLNFFRDFMNLPSRNFGLISYLLVFIFFNYSFTLPNQSYNPKLINPEYRLEFEARYLNSQTNRYYGKLSKIKKLDNEDVLITLSYQNLDQEFLMKNPSFVPEIGSQMWVEYLQSGDHKILQNMDLAS